MSERVVVALVLVGVGLGELGKSPLERRSSPEIAGDGDAVTRAGVRARQGLGTHPGVLDQALRDRPLDLEAPLPVP